MSLALTGQENDARQRGTLFNDDFDSSDCVRSTADHRTNYIQDGGGGGGKQVLGQKKNLFQCVFVHHRSNKEAPGLETWLLRYDAGQKPSEVQYFQEVKKKQSYVSCHDSACTFDPRLHQTPLRSQFPLLNTTICQLVFTSRF